MSLVLLLAMTCAPALAARTVVVAIVGDGIAAGAPDHFSPRERPPEGEGDPEHDMSYWIMKKRPNWKVLNFGMRGQASDQVRVLLEDALKAGPQYVVVIAGGEDIRKGPSIRALGDNLLWMYRRAKGYYAIPIATTVPPWNTSTERQQEERRRVNAWIRKAADKDRIPLVDLAAVVTDREDLEKLDGSSDGIHPDAGGHRAMGMAVMRAVDHMETHRPR